ncbi:NADH:flavin oxidoreductase [Ampullimonas aquatilis]|uniref:NADH:flavin oxidoreductase n=1 Tax=Ampullimonas aquatilis TaxID=1341549 RepID=UPI003C78272A
MSAAPAALQPLFQPMPFGKGELKNRIVMAPMTRQHSPGGIPGNNVVEYYARRARGGVGLIITEGTYVGHVGANGYDNVPAFSGAAALSGWKKVVDAVHAAGGKIAPQIWHTGMMRRPGTEPVPSQPGYGPMEIQEEGKVVVKAMDKQDIADVIAAFAKAAADAKDVGFDGLEIHGAHQYLLDAFMWEKTNQRTDEYGGPLANRIRLAVEVVTAVRAAVGPDFPIIYRFSQWKITDYDARIGNTPEELGVILNALAKAGVDIFHASQRRFWEPAFDGSPDNLATWAEKLTGKPAITVGSVGLNTTMSVELFMGLEEPNGQYADISALAKGVTENKYHLIAVGRALLSEPDWANKLRDSRQEEIKGFDKTALTTLVV